MKTYNERLRSIQKKARVKKAVRFSVKVTVSVFVLVAIVWAAGQIPNFGDSAANMQAPALTGPAAPITPTTTAPRPNDAPTEPTQTPDILDPIQPEPAPTTPIQGSFGATCISVKTTQPSPVDTYPAIHLIRSQEAMEAFCQQRKQEFCGFEAVEYQAGFYSDTFFESRSLVVVMLAESSGSIRHNLLGIAFNPDGSICFEIERTVPEMGTCDMAYWYLFIEVNRVLSQDTPVTINWTNSIDKVENVAAALGDLPEAIQKIVVGEYTYNSADYQYHKYRIPLHGVFDGVYIYVNTLGFTNWMPSTEAVNDLEFYYPKGYKMLVITDEGCAYSLTEAFASGIISVEQLQQIYDSYQRYGTELTDRPYNPDTRVYIMLDTHNKLTHWGKHRFRFTYSVDDFYKKYYLGDQVRVQVEVTNYGAPMSIDTFKDTIGEFALLIGKESEYKIESERWNCEIIGQTDDQWLTGETIAFWYTFTIPEEVQNDNYCLRITVSDMVIYFNEESTQAERSIYVLATLSEERQQMIHALHPQVPEFQGQMPVYYSFSTSFGDDIQRVFIYMYPTGSTEGVATSETISGLEFAYPPGYSLYVFREGMGLFTLTDAFESGIIARRDLIEAHDNYLWLATREKEIWLEEMNVLFGDLNGWYNKALTSEYDTPAQLLLSQFFLNAFIEDGNEVTDSECAQLKELYGFSDFIDTVDITRLPVDRMNLVLLAYFGITLDEIDVAADNDLHYLESTNCYYIVGGGAPGVMDFKAISFETLQDGSICVYYTVNWEETVYAVTLMPTDDGYRILSNMKVE